MKFRFIQFFLLLLLLCSCNNQASEVDADKDYNSSSAGDPLSVSNNANSEIESSGEEKDTSMNSNEAESSRIENSLPNDVSDEQSAEDTTHDLSGNTDSAEETYENQQNEVSPTSNVETGDSPATAPEKKWFNAAGAIAKTLGKHEYGGLYYERNDNGNEAIPILVVTVLNKEAVKEKIESAYPDQEEIYKLKYKNVKYSLAVLESISDKLSTNMEMYDIKECGTNIERNCIEVVTKKIDMSIELRNFLDSENGTGCIEVSYNNRVFMPMS